MEKKLYRDEDRKVIAGVCAGLADYLGVDVTFVRIGFIILTIFGKGAGLIAYIIMGFTVPRKARLFNEPFVDYRVPPFNQQEPNAAQQQPPFTPPFYPPVKPVKKDSTSRIVFGVVLILLGAAFLLDQFDIVPYLDFRHTWPIIIIAVGGVMIFSPKKERPWEKDDWHKAEEPDTTDNSSNNNPPTL